MRRTTGLRGRSLVENLEPRQMFSADPATLRDAGLVPIDWHGEEAYVRPGEFILSLDGAPGGRGGDGPGQLAAVNALLRRLAGQTGATATRHLGDDGLVLLSAPADAAFDGLNRALQRLPGFEFLEPNFAISATAVTPNDTHFARLWGLNNTGQTYGGNSGSAGTAGADIDAPEAWGSTKGSLGTVIAVLDSGADHTHVDLHRNVWINQGEIPAAAKLATRDVDGDGLLTFRDLNNPANAGVVADANANGYVDGADLLKPAAGGGWADGADGDDLDGNPSSFVDDLIGWDFVNRDNNPLDDQGHGTHTAGTIGATGNNGLGVTGVNWDVQVMPLKVLGADTSGLTSDSVAALNYARNLKVGRGVALKATNNSYGGGPYSQAMYDAVRDNGTADILFVASAGNGDRFGRAINTDKTLAYPAAYGYNGKTFDDPATSLVERHPSLENVIAVTATDSRDARGSFANYGALSVDLGAPGVDVYSLAMNGGYKFNTGTSMAAPHVAGVIGLAASLAPTATAAQLKDAIVNSASVDLISSMSTTTSSKGRLDANKALARIKAVAPVAPGTPGGLAGTAASATHVDLKWNDVNGETGYNLQRAPDVGGAPGAFADVAQLGANVTAYRDASLTADTAYHYRVRASNTAGDSAYSGPVRVATKAAADAPNAPGNLTAVATSANQVNLAWVDNSADETGFRIERSRDATFPSGATDAFTVADGVSTYADTDLPGLTTYHYRVQAVRTDTLADGTAVVRASAFSNPAAATTAGSGTGLRGDYYAQMVTEDPAVASAFSLNAANLKFSRTDATVDFTTWGNGSPSQGGVALPVDKFSVKWTGAVQPRFTDNYVFRFEPDDGVGMWIWLPDASGQLQRTALWTPTWDRYDGTSSNGTSTEYANTSAHESAALPLQAGVKYAIEVVYYEWSGGASAKLLWRSAKQAQEVIPASQLYAPAESGTAAATSAATAVAGPSTAMPGRGGGTGLFSAKRVDDSSEESRLVQDVVG